MRLIEFPGSTLYLPTSILTSRSFHDNSLTRCGIVATPVSLHGLKNVSPVVDRTTISLKR